MVSSIGSDVLLSSLEVEEVDEDLRIPPPRDILKVPYLLCRCSKEGVNVDGSIANARAMG